VLWLWIVVAILAIPLLFVLAAALMYFHLVYRFLDVVVRCFMEKPLFIVPRGQPVPGAEDVKLLTPDGLTLRGCYLKAQQPRRGVILFGLEFGSNRWACTQYCEHLVAGGFDVFSFEPRGQGESDPEPGYEPLQWISNHEVADFKTAIAYLRNRPDSDPHGIGFFGISKGAGTGLLAAASEPYVCCFVTDGVFGTYTTVVPYMRKWISIYSNRRWIQAIMPNWMYGLVGRTGLRKIGRQNSCRFPHLERSIAKLAPRPLLMIHGGGDTYIKPDMARSLFDRAGQPKEFWLVDGAKHNQALVVAGEDYRRRVLEFFQRHLVDSPRPVPSRALAGTA
jgi:pimeloyl-ACP methyl ester carboxylesterase